MQINYRSYYGSVRGIIDQDLCHEYLKLDTEVLKGFLEQMEMSENEAIEILMQNSLYNL